MLRELTNRIWQALSVKPELRGFSLVGGSALALHLHHRISEDLDFAWPHPRLPREALHQLINNNDANLHFKAYQDPWAQREADDAGLNLDDYSQTYFVNDAVKTTLFCLELPERKILASVATDRLHLASVPEIFALKSLLVAKRSKAATGLIFMS